VELWEGLSLDLVLDLKPDVSVSSRSGTLRSRFIPVLYFGVVKLKLNDFCHLYVQLELQQALLSVGEFQSTVDGLMSWISQTLASFSHPPPLYADTRTIDAELSRLQVLVYLSNVTLF